LRDLERLLDLERRVLEFDFDLLDDLFLRFVLEFDLVLVLLLETDLLVDFRRLRDLERFLDRDLDLRDCDLDLRDRDLDSAKRNSAIKPDNSLNVSPMVRSGGPGSSDYILCVRDVAAAKERS